MGKNIFQRLIDGLFDEVEIEEEIEEKQEEEVKLPPVSNVVLPDRAKPVTLKEKEEQPIRKEVLKKENRSTMISVDDLKEPTPLKKTPVERKAKPEYEFTQVISPIFGVVGEENKTSGDAFVPSTPKKKKTAKPGSILGTVISPIYGINREESAVDMDFELTEEEAPLSIDDLIEKQEAAPEKTEKKDEPEGAKQPSDSIDHEAYLDSLIKSLEEEEAVQEGSLKRMAEGQNLSLFDDFDEHS